MDSDNRTPHIKIILWLEACRMTFGKELDLDSEEREMIPYELYDHESESEIIHPLDEPWEIKIDDNTGYFADELKIKAWINSFGDKNSSDSIIVHHDTPKPRDKYDNYPTSELHPGEEVVATIFLDQGLAIYKVSLHIKWPIEQESALTLDEAIQRLQEGGINWKEIDHSNEIETSLAHGPKKAKKYKVYKPEEFPEKFISDLRSDKDAVDDLTQIVVQTYAFRREWCEHSDDYKDAAEAFGEDCSGWWSTERYETKPHLILEIDSKS